MIVNFSFSLLFLKVTHILLIMVTGQMSHFCLAFLLVWFNSWGFMKGLSLNNHYFNSSGNGGDS